MEPNIAEIRDWILATIRHCCHVEYYLMILEVEADGAQRPHDIVGPGNKLEWPVIKGLSLNNRSYSEAIAWEIKTAILCHRQQHHHQMWNSKREFCHGIWMQAPSELATEDELRLGAIDAICSLREPERKYQGGLYSWTRIIERTHNDHRLCQHWMREMLKFFRDINPPQITIVDNLFQIPSIGLSRDMEEKIQQRLEESLAVLKNDFGYDLRQNQTSA